MLNLGCWAEVRASVTLPIDNLWLVKNSEMK